MDLTGTWYNELQSTLVIDSVSNGEFTGTYETAVSSGGCAKGKFSVIGKTDVDSGGQAIAFVVCWNNDQSNCASVTAWSGQAQVVQGEEKIIAMWLLTTETDPDDDWTSTRVGQDVFTRNRPAADLTKIPKVLQRSHI